MDYEFISKGSAIGIIEDQQRALCPLGRCSRYAVYGSDRDAFDNWQEIVDLIEAIPAADVVEVIRCKDCKFTKTDGCEDSAIYCEKWDMWEMPPDGFCYRGRRR